MHFPSYGDFIGAMGYTPADDSVVDRGGDSIWRISQNGNHCRFSDDGNIRATVCRSRSGQIGYVWNVGNQSGWNGPFDSFDKAMDHADNHIFSR